MKCKLNLKQVEGKKIIYRAEINEIENRKIIDKISKIKIGSLNI